MLRQYANFFSNMQVHLSDMVHRLRLEQLSSGDTSNLERAADGSDWSALHNDDFWTRFQKECEEVDLESGVRQIQRIMYELKTRPDMRRSQLEGMLNDLRHRIEDELLQRFFLYVPYSKAWYWENEDCFGEEVGRKFPEAVHDIYEACSCFAVGRTDAIVYHCMGVVQETIFKVAHTLGCTVDPELDDWGSAEKKINQKLEERRLQAETQRGDAAVWSQWKRTEAAYAELISDFNAVKKAFRHRSAHFRHRYNESEAEKVLDRVRDFAQHAASLLPD